MKVSVLMITYNHEPFIAQAIESVLVQRTEFDYELVIGEDCSTDRTREIVVGYRDRYPDRIRVLLPEKNLGMHRSFMATLEACTGEYVALLEGDDYWTSIEKLQRQVNFLDNHPECTVCFHKVTGFRDGASHLHETWPPGLMKQVSTLEDLLRDDFIPTCSAMFRRSAVGSLPAWFHDLRMVDWPLFVICAESGRIGFIDAEIAAYRIHRLGVWSSLDLLTRLKAHIAFYERINTYLGFKYDDIIQTAMATTRARLYVEMAYDEFAKGQIQEATSHLKQAIQLNPCILENQGRQLFEGFAHWAGCGLVGNPVEFIKTVYTNLPKAADVLRGRRHEALALAWMTRFYRAYNRKDWSSVRDAFPQAVIHNFHWLRNRGAIVMWLESIIGTNRMATLRRAARRKCSPAFEY